MVHCITTSSFGGRYPKPRPICTGTFCFTYIKHHIFFLPHVLLLSPYPHPPFLIPTFTIFSPPFRGNQIRGHPVFSTLMTMRGREKVYGSLNPSLELLRPDEKPKKSGSTGSGHILFISHKSINFSSPLPDSVPSFHNPIPPPQTEGSQIMKNPWDTKNPSPHTHNFLPFGRSGNVGLRCREWAGYRVSGLCRWKRGGARGKGEGGGGRGKGGVLRRKGGGCMGGKKKDRLGICWALFIRTGKEKKNGKFLPPSPLFFFSFLHFYPFLVRKVSRSEKKNLTAIPYL